MSFYDLTKEQRQQLVENMSEIIFAELKNGGNKQILQYFSDDTYIRKTGYLAIGKLYKANKNLHATILKLLETFLKSANEKIRQTGVNAAGEIGMMDFSSIENLMEKGLFDEHHSVRNAVIGSIKKMGEKNPKPTLAFAKKFLHHKDKEIRREICHGIELRGRTHPEDILPMLKELEDDKTVRVRNTLIHVLGQIAYKKGCLETVVAHLKTWTNKELVADALVEIIDVHERYKNFSIKTQEQAISYIERNYR